MNSHPSLTGSNLRTYERIFQHPISHNLEWREVRALLAKIGETEEQHNGNLKVTRNGQVLVLHSVSKKDIAEMDDLMKLRHFLERSETPEKAIGQGQLVHRLLVIDHHQARIFHTEVNGGIPETLLTGKPKYFRHERDSKTTSMGQEKPNPNTFFEIVAKGLETAGPILLLGNGTGSSNEAEQFNEWTKVHHRPIADRIVGTLVVDEHHLSDAELLAKARDFFDAGSSSVRPNTTS